MGDVDSVCERAMNHLDLLNVAFSFPMEILVNHPPVITIFIGGMFMSVYHPPNGYCIIVLTTIYLYIGGIW